MNGKKARELRKTTQAVYNHKVRSVERRVVKKTLMQKIRVLISKIFRKRIRVEKEISVKNLYNNVKKLYKCKKLIQE